MPTTLSTTHVSSAHVTGTYGAPYPRRRDDNAVHLTGRAVRDLPAMARAWRAFTELPPLSR